MDICTGFCVILSACGSEIQQELPLETELPLLITENELGKLYEVALTVEGYQSSGAANIYRNEIIIEEPEQ